MLGHRLQLLNRRVVFFQWIDAVTILAQGPYSRTIYRRFGLVEMTLSKNPKPIL